MMQNVFLSYPLPVHIKARFGQPKISAWSANLRLEHVALAMGPLVVMVDPCRVEGIVQIVLKVPALVVEVVGHRSIAPPRLPLASPKRRAMFKGIPIMPMILTPVRHSQSHRSTVPLPSPRPGTAIESQPTHQRLTQMNNNMEIVVIRITIMMNPWIKGTINGSLVRQSLRLLSHLSRGSRPRTYFYGLMYQFNHLCSQAKLGCPRSPSRRTQHPPVCWPIYKHPDNLYNRSPTGIRIVD